MLLFDSTFIKSPAPKFSILCTRPNSFLSAEKTLKSLIEVNSIFDLVFIDADKANYTTYFDFAINLVKRNGLIIFDNVLWHGDVAKKNVTDDQTELIRKFNMYIKNDKKTEKTILPIGDGLTICRKL